MYSFTMHVDESTFANSVIREVNKIKCWYSVNFINYVVKETYVAQDYPQ